MAQPSSRQGLIDYGLRQLGAPVLEINIDDDQIDDLLDDAIQVFNERHFDGVEEMYLKHEFTQEEIDTLNNKIVSIGPKTSAAIREYAPTDIIESKKPSIEQLLEVLIKN